MKAASTNEVKHAVSNTNKYNILYVLYPIWIPT